MRSFNATPETFKGEVMGDRYHIESPCTVCGSVEEMYYAPTCGFTHHTCSKCGNVVDLEALTGITYEDASNRDEIEELCKKAAMKKAQQ